MRQQATISRTLVATLLGGVLLLAACSGSTPEPAPTTATTLPECAWGEDAITAANRAIAVTTNDTEYELVDTTSGRVLGTCPVSGPDGVGSSEAAYQPLTFQGRTAYDQNFNELWFGGFRPGGPGGTMVITPSGTVDLATGDRIDIIVDGYQAAAVGRSEIVMVREGTGISSAPPTAPTDWCVVQLSSVSASSASSSLEGPSCTSITDAVGSGTPVVTGDGDVAWLSTELTATDITLDADDPEQPALYLRRGQGLVTATGYVNDGYPNAYDGGYVSASGQAFLVLPASGTAGAISTNQPVTWYTVGPDDVLRPHRAGQSYRDVGQLVGDDLRYVVTDTNVTDDGRTLLLTVDLNAEAALIAIPEQGEARIVFRTPPPSPQSNERPEYLRGGDQFVTAVALAQS